MSIKLNAIISYWEANFSFSDASLERKALMLYLLQVWHFHYFSVPAFSDAFHLSESGEIELPGLEDVAPDHSVSVSIPMQSLIYEIDRRFSAVPINTLMHDLQSCDAVWKMVRQEGRSTISVFDIKRCASGVGIRAAEQSV
jgi:hypothetical protein